MSLHVRFIPSLVRWNQGRRRIQTNSVPDLLLISVISLFIEKWVFNVRKEHNDWSIGQEDQKKKNLSIHSFQVCFSFSHFTHFNVRLEQRWLRKEGVGTSVRKPCSRRMFRAAVPLGLLLTDFYRGLTHTSCNESRFMYDCSHLRSEFSFLLIRVRACHSMIDHIVYDWSHLKSVPSPILDRPLGCFGSCSHSFLSFVDPFGLTTLK